MSFLLRDVQVDGRIRDVRVRDGYVEAIGQLDPLVEEEVLSGAGAALIPGLHDHHLHLLAMAARDQSVDVSEGLEPLLADTGSGWLRAVGWTGEGDRHDLDRVVDRRPLRVQHRSGALWVLNSAAVETLELEAASHPGIERDDHGVPTGRIWRADDWLGERLGRVTPDVSQLGRSLAALGITGVTDATPDLDETTCELLRRCVPQRLLLLGDPHESGPVKVVLADHELPSLPELAERLRRIRPRPVAVHCVTRVALVLLRAALDDVGWHPGDRIEHGAVVPPELASGLPLCVTQPAMLSARGDDYLRDAEPDDANHLYPYGELLALGVPVVPSSDAPFGPLDPWQVLRSARDRSTASGARIPGPGVPVEVALDGMLRPLEDPTAPARRVTVGAPADLVLLRVPLAHALADPDAGLVRATWIAGELAAGS